MGSTAFRLACMTVYSELLQARLESDGDEPELPLAELVADVVARRCAAARSRPPSGPGGDLATNLEYDAALVRLCRRIGVTESLTGSSPAPDARRTAEDAVAARLPGLAEAFTG